MKRAFSMIELIIVLVVIGLLSVGLYSGISLYETAKLRKELNQIRKLQTAVPLYISDTLNENFLLSNIANDYINPKPLIDMNLIDSTDFKSTYYFGNVEYYYKRCIVDYNYLKQNKGLSINKIGKNICISAKLITVSAANVYEADKLTHKVICGYESIYDDKDLETGLGRGLDQVALEYSLDYSNCESIKDYNNKTTNVQPDLLGLNYAIITY